MSGMEPHDGGEDGEFAECLEAARALLSGNEDTSDLWEANDLVNRALACLPQSAEAWLVKAQILSALGDDPAALACVEMVLRRHPKTAEAHYWHTAILADLERWDEALRAVERAFRCAGPDDEWLIEDLYYEKGVILDTMGRPEAAIATFQAGLLRCPESALLKAGLEPLHRERVRRRFKVIPGGRA